MKSQRQVFSLNFVYLLRFCISRQFDEKNLVAFVPPRARGYTVRNNSLRFENYFQNSNFKMNQEKLKQLQAQVRIGGKGTARRKKKVVHRTATTDDKKLQSSLKKLSVSLITVTHFCTVFKLS